MTVSIAPMSALVSVPASATEPEAAPVSLRIRVQTDEGAFLVYDAMIPPDNPRDQAGYLAYWSDVESQRIYFYSGLVQSDADVGRAMLALERDLLIDLGGITEFSPTLAWRLDQALLSVPERDTSRGGETKPNRSRSRNESQLSSATAWQPLTYSAAMAAMGFDVGGSVAVLPPPESGEVPCDQPFLSTKPSQRRNISDRSSGIIRAVALPAPTATTPREIITQAVGLIPCIPGDSGGGGGGGGGDPPPDGCPPPDTNCDGIIDSPCPGDIDCDGVPDTADDDLDGDGVPNGTDPDVDGDGINNASDPDVDGDGILNGDDTDVDGDGVPNGDDPDVDGDGIPNGSDPDVDGDGVDNGGDADVDGDGIPNGNDPDVDGDGVDNAGDTDVDGDGIPNGSDSDIDGDGVPNGDDGDADGDGDPNGGDSDPRGECIDSADGTGCDDLNICTRPDLCASNACFGQPVVCDDNDECTFNLCSQVTGLCEFPPVDCNDGSSCTDDCCDPLVGCRNATAAQPCSVQNAADAFVCLGSTVVVSADVCNPSACTKTFDWSVTQTGGIVQLSFASPVSGTVTQLPGGQCQTVEVTVGAPATAFPGDVAGLEFRAISRPDEQLPGVCFGGIAAEPVPCIANVLVTVPDTPPTLTPSPTFIPAKTAWPGAAWHSSDITVTWNPPDCEGTLKIVTPVVAPNGYTPPNAGTLQRINATTWRYTSFDEPQTELCPPAISVKIAAMQGTTELARVSVLVLPVHTWWTRNHRHGPGATSHAPTTADFTNDYNFIRWKYAGVLATTGGVFSSVTISTSAAINCGSTIALACTSAFNKVTFGTNTFSGSENQAASIIGHELVHTVSGVFSSHCLEYQWEKDHRFITGIFPCDMGYDASVNLFLSNNSCP